ncbi:PAS domain-containing protein, partial [Halodesulfurarchaeum sp.]|uniref:PAS domain-containing protein n=1 Tax=Halodesulfurarchaeum sp. TaxID=1980530 RepID=UPI002FC2EC69
MSEQNTELFEDPSRTSPRVLPLISDKGNRKQLADWIDSHETLESVPFEDELEAIDFDVCILDKRALRDHREELARIKAEAEPVIVPYLLLVPEYDESLIEFEQERLIDAVTPASVDEIASLPIKQKELEWRVRALLRLRNQSIRSHTTGRRYQSFFDSIRDSILIADTDRKIVDCNQAFTNLFGYSLSEIAGKPTHTVYESKEEFEEMGAAIEDHIGDPEFTKIVSYQTKTGESFPGETNVFYLRDQEGEIKGIVGLIRDVSEQLERKRELERYEAAVEGST